VEAVVVLLALAAVIMATAFLLRERSQGRRRVADAERARRELEEALARVERERASMGLVLSSMREGILLVGREGTVTFANPALERLVGGRPASLEALLPFGLREAVRAATADGTRHDAEVETGADARWLRGDAFPVGEDGAVLLIVRDVTEARRMESVRRDFVANASHELKTPAASIQAAAETIRTAALDDPDVVPRFAAQLEQEAVRLSRIVADLLDLSRLEVGSELEETVALDAILRDELERFEGAAAEGGVKLEIRADGVPRVRGSARDLALMIRNLVDNAIRYTRPGGRVEVTLAGSGAEVVLTVTDTGVGIPSRDLDRVFERFYRVDRARSRETGGTGLGLSIVRHVVENHGGTVGVRSELGVGSTFEVRLPAAA
jgi:signal transduction histidine kinase